MGKAISIKLELPGDLARFRLPKAVNQRLHDLLDKQDSGQRLTARERREAEGLVDIADLISVLKLRLIPTPEETNKNDMKPLPKISKKIKKDRPRRGRTDHE